MGKIEQTVVVPNSYEGLPKHFSLKGFILGEKVEGKASPTSLLGWTVALTNPFNVQIAQKIAEVPIGSGMGLR